MEATPPVASAPSPPHRSFRALGLGGWPPALRIAAPPSPRAPDQVNAHNATRSPERAKCQQAARRVAAVVNRCTRLRKLADPPGASTRYARHVPPWARAIQLPTSRQPGHGCNRPKRKALPFRRKAGLGDPSVPRPEASPLSPDLRTPGGSPTKGTQYRDPARSLLRVDATLRLC